MDEPLSIVLFSGTDDRLESAAILVGGAAGLGGFTFFFAQGASYLKDDPKTCMNCHKVTRTDSPHIQKLAAAFESGRPFPWERVHALPDHVYFDHRPHVGAGIACQTCHGEVQKMPLMRQAEPLTMSWCLDCHRDPASHLRPPELVTKMDWVAPEDPEVYGRRLMKESKINPSTQCWTCHR